MSTIRSTCSITPPSVFPVRSPSPCGDAGGNVARKVARLKALAPARPTDPCSVGRFFDGGRSRSRTAGSGAVWRGGLAPEALFEYQRTARCESGDIYLE